MLGSDQYLIRGKQNFITRRVHTVQHAVKAVEALGARVEVEVGAGRDHTQDPQELSQDQGLVQEALIIVEIEVAVASIYAKKGGLQEAEVDHLAHKYIHT